MAPEEQRHLAAIERFVGRAIPRVLLPDFDYKLSPSQLQQTVIYDDERVRAARRAAMGKVGPYALARAASPGRASMPSRGVASPSRAGGGAVTRPRGALARRALPGARRRRDGAPAGARSRPPAAAGGCAGQGQARRHAARQGAAEARAEVEAVREAGARGQAETRREAGAPGEAETPGAARRAAREEVTTGPR